MNPTRRSKIFQFLMYLVGDARDGCDFTYRLVRHVLRRVRSKVRRATVLGCALCLVASLSLTTASASAAGATSAAPQQAQAPQTSQSSAISDVCGLTASPPPPALNTEAFLAESSSNTVEVLDESTGELIGSPVPVGTNPQGIAFWQPLASSSQDPLVVVANNDSGGSANSVSVLDALTLDTTATISLPTGSGPTSVAASPSNTYAVVVDSTSGDVSIINLANNTDAGQIALTSTANSLSSVTFSASGEYAFVTDPATHSVYVLEYTGGSAPYFTNETADAYTNSSIDPTGIATDVTSSASSTLVVGNALSTSGSLLMFNDSAGDLATSYQTPTTVTGFTAKPGSLTLSAGATTVYAVISATNTVDQVTLSSGATEVLTASAFTGDGPVALAAGSATLITADTASANLDGFSVPVSAATSSAAFSTGTNGTVSAIAPAFGGVGSWNAYVIDDGNIDVINTSTDSVTQSFADSNTPEAIATSPDGKYVYVANTDSVSVIQTSDIGTSTNPIVATITGIKGSAQPDTPELNGIAVSPDGDAVIVTDYANGSLDTIDTHVGDSAYRTVVARVGLLDSGTYSSTQTTAGGVAFSPDGLYAYATEFGSTGSDTHDGVLVLQKGSSTSAGYVAYATNQTLTQDGNTLWVPDAITITPNDEYAEVTGTSSSETPIGGLFNFPLKGSNEGGSGELANGSTIRSPIWTGSAVADVAASPEDAAGFVTSSTSLRVTSVNQLAYSTNWYATTDGLPGAVAVSPDGIYLAVATDDFCNDGANALEFFDANTGSQLATVGLPTTPLAIAFAPQSAPQTVTASELAGGASNPAEEAVTQGMNDIVSGGTPSDAPGASAGVDTANLQYSLSLDSMNVPDVGIDLDQSATYDSSMAATTGVLGKGWTSSYGITAKQAAYNASSGPCDVTVTQEDWATVTFAPSTPGPYSSTCPATGYEAPRWAQATMTFASSCNGSDSCFAFNRDAQETFYIDETSGELVKEVDLHSNTVTLTWGSHSVCPGASSTELCQVTGADTGIYGWSARTLTYSYPSPGSGTCQSAAASCVVVTDPLGRTLTYALNSSSQLASVTLANTSASDITSATYDFSYNSSSEMTSWCDPEVVADGACTDGAETTVAWTSGLVSSVTGPTTAPPLSSSVSPASLMQTTYDPEVTFAREDWDTSTNNGAVEIANADFNADDEIPGEDVTLDTYANDELVSSTPGFGGISNYDGLTFLPLPAETATPMRDRLNLMPDETMNALAGSTDGSNGTSPDSGVTIDTYDAWGNVLSSTDPSGETSTYTYNNHNEELTSQDALGNVTSNTYDSDGDLLTTTSPAVSPGGIDPVNSNWYNSYGDLCASRDALETAVYGALSSCVSSGSHATVFAYDGAGDLLSTTDPSGDTGQNLYDSDGDLCAKVTADGVVAGKSLGGCPSTGEPYATANLDLDVYNQPTETLTSLDTAGTQFASSYACYNLNSDEIDSVGPLGSAPSCSDLTPSSSPDSTFTYYNHDGDAYETISPQLAASTQGPTTVSAFDADDNEILQLSPQGFLVWAANHSATLTAEETFNVNNNLSETAIGGPASDDTSGCLAELTAATHSVCPDTTGTYYDQAGESTSTLTPSSSNAATPQTVASTYNPDATEADSTAPVSGTTVTSTPTYDADQNVIASQNTDGGTLESGTTTAYEPDGAVCWSASTYLSSSVCSSPPTSPVDAATEDYYNLDGDLIATVGPGGAGTVGTESGDTCNPVAAFGTFSLNTSDLCAFTTYRLYNEDGELVTQIQPSLSSSTSGYVAAGATTTYTYDASGNQATLTNPDSEVTTNTYDADNRLVAVSYSDISAKTCDSSTENVCYSYNVDGTRASMTDSSGTTSYAYDTVGQLTSVTDGNGHTVTYGYNASGQLFCVSYPGATSACGTSENSNGAPSAYQVYYNYDSQGRLSSVIDWNGDAFTYAYDCAGNVAWLAASAAGDVAPVSQCVGAGGMAPVAPMGGGSSGKWIETEYVYTAGSSGNQLAYQTTSYNDGGTPTSLLGFGSSSSNLVYDDYGNLYTETPIVNGTARAADNYRYDSTQQRVISGPEAGSSASTDYTYVNSGSSTFQSSNTVDEMGINTVGTGSTPTGLQYAGNGELCWKEPSAAATSSCSAPSSTYESFNYDPSGNRTGSTPYGGYGTSSDLSWSQDTHTLSCADMSGTTCPSTPSGSAPTAADYTYNADGLRLSAAAWSSGSVVETDYTWNSTNSALLSDGTFDYLYGLNPNVPIAQIDLDDSVTSELITDTNSNVRGVVELTSTAHSPDTLAQYTDYDVYGNPITGSGGSTNAGGLTNEVGTDPDSASKFGYGGGYEDATGLIYLVHRYYDPITGQFLSVDPDVGSTGTPYAYAGDDPIDSTDPTGLWTEGWCVQGSAGWAIATASGSICLVEANGNQQVGITWQVNGSLGLALSPSNFAKEIAEAGPNNWVNYVLGSAIENIHGAGASLTLNYAISTCQSIKCFATGKFSQASLSVGDGWGGSVEYFWGKYDGTSQGGISIGGGSASGLVFSLAGRSPAHSGFKLLGGNAANIAAGVITGLNTFCPLVWAVRTLSRDILSSIFPRA